MPSSKKHAQVGLAIGAIGMAGLNIIQQLERQKANPGTRFDWGELILKTISGGVIGGTASLLPDILEPATSPFHRKFFHSLAASALLAYGGYKVQTSEEIPQEVKEILLLIKVAYGSHLVMDSQTPMGLPLI